MSEKNTDSAETPRSHTSQTAQRPAPPAGDVDVSPKSPRPDPTRYGDWEKNGQCIDF